jgi:hypothetical protein
MREVATSLMLLSLAACGGVQSSNVGAEMWEQFDSRLAELSGHGAKDCGYFGLNENGGAVISCVVAARKNRVAFRASAARQGIDSRLIIGLAQNASGELFKVLGDSDIHGGGGHVAKPAIIAWRCKDLKENIITSALLECIGGEKI